ncbi:hypothetical protein IQ07DRAFT_190604 [Pyrenochaeta sp. DS3sAY3a]|nr:hypothetical protein IQ07DRAFT_190604 [Pyrenochaeta sp. DS3sAY3a]
MRAATQTKCEQSVSAMDNQDNTRKRVKKACNLCRIKKLKCDAMPPCKSCVACNAACEGLTLGEDQNEMLFEYIHLLEMENNRVKTGLQALFKLVKAGQGELATHLDRRPSTDEIINLIQTTISSSIRERQNGHPAYRFPSVSASASSHNPPPVTSNTLDMLPSSGNYSLLVGPVPSDQDTWGFDLQQQ